ncbi:MAG TPA: MarR family transcriptional regulator [Pirellulales bacterium]|jgi:DNA-binding MarR family transcriptional regulator|nr:MarR family transcriptional regulator [Pirellulales bacterium]
MDQTCLNDHAEAIANLLPQLTRQLFVADDPMSAKLPVAQLRVCGILFAGPRSMSALARELSVSLSAMTQIADRLERARLVKRVTVGADRRVRCLQLTARGEKLMARRQGVLVARVSQVLEQIPAPDQPQVLSSLQALMDGCAAANQRELATRLG